MSDECCYGEGGGGVWSDGSCCCGEELGVVGDGERGKEDNSLYFLIELCFQLTEELS